MRFDSNTSYLQRPNYQNCFFTCRTQLYDPSSPLSSDSESEVLKAQHRKPPSNIQEKSVGCQRLSPNRHKRSRWASCYSEPGGLPEGRAYGPETESLDRPGYGLKSGPPEQRGCSPDRVLHGSSSQVFPEPYRGRRSNGEERTLPEYRREVPQRAARHVLLLC